MRHFRRRIFILGAALCVCFGAPAQSVDELAAAHVEALGGEKALRNVKSIARSGQARVSGVAGTAVS